MNWDKQLGVTPQAVGQALFEAESRMRGRTDKITFQDALDVLEYIRDHVPMWSKRAERALSPGVFSISAAAAAKANSWGGSLANMPYDDPA